MPRYMITVKDTADGETYSYRTIASDYETMVEVANYNLVLETEVVVNVTEIVPLYEYHMVSPSGYMEECDNEEDARYIAKEYVYGMGGVGYVYKVPHYNQEKRKLIAMYVNDEYLDEYPPIAKVEYNVVKGWQYDDE